MGCHPIPSMKEGLERAQREQDTPEQGRPHDSRHRRRRDDHLLLRFDPCRGRLYLAPSCPGRGASTHDFRGSATVSFRRNPLSWTRREAPAGGGYQEVRPPVCYQRLGRLDSMRVQAVFEPRSTLLGPYPRLRE